MTHATLRRFALRCWLGVAGVIVLSAGYAAAQEDPLRDLVPPPLTPARPDTTEAPKTLPESVEAIPVERFLPETKEEAKPTDENPPSKTSLVDDEVKQASCSSCGGRKLGGGCSSCGGGPSRCVPGRKNCDECCYFGDGPCGRLLAGLHECLCCPDPCYEPLWLPAADSAFWLDAARPKSQLKLYWTTVWDFSNPDAAEWFWARIGAKGPTRNGNGPVGNVDYKDLRMYTEAAAERFSVFVDYGYRRTDPEFFTGHGGFDDLIVGTKTMLIDCELMQLTFQFKTYIPTGASASGLGTGHVSLEPSLLANVRLADDAYIQAQAAFWIPVGGTSDQQGSIFHYHFSVNKVLWAPCRDLQLVGVGEFGGYYIGDGEYTVDTTVPTRDRATAVGDIFYVAPGLRLFICEYLDVGASFNLAVTDDNFGDKQLKLEFRWRF